MTTRKTIQIPVKLLYYLRNNVQKEYRRHHPDMKMIKLSDAKLFYETVKFYVKNTTFQLDEEDEL